MLVQSQVSSKVDVRDWSRRRVNNARAGIIDPSPTPVGIYFRKTEIEDLALDKAQITFAIVNRAMGIAGWGYVSSSGEVDTRSLCLYERSADMRRFIEWLEEQEFVLAVESTSNKTRVFSSQNSFNSYTEYQIMRQCLTYLSLTSTPQLLPDLGLDRLSPDESKELLAYLEAEQIIAYLPQFFLLFLRGEGESKIQRVYTAPKIEAEVPRPDFRGQPLDFQVPAPPRGLMTQPVEWNPSLDEKSIITPSTIIDELRKHLPNAKLWEKLPPRFFRERHLAKQDFVNIYIDGYAWKMLEWEKAWLQRSGIGSPVLLSPSKLGEVVRTVEGMTVSGKDFTTWSRGLITRFATYEKNSLIRYGSQRYPVIEKSIFDAIEKAIIINGYASTQNYDDREYGNIFIPITLNARARLSSLKEEHRSDLEALLSWARKHDPGKISHIRDLLYDRPIRDVFGHQQCATLKQCQKEPDNPSCEMYAALMTLDLS